MAIKNLGRVVGADGKSAYEIWLEKGNTGTEQDFLNSLKGSDGVDGKDGTNGSDYVLTDKDKAEIADLIDVDVTGEVVPAYVKAEAERVADNILSVRNADSFVFAGISDIHTDGIVNEDDWTAKALKNTGKALTIINDYANLDLFAIFGDTVAGYFTDDYRQAFKYARECFSDIRKSTPSIQLQGNHDQLKADTTEEGEQKYWAYIGANNVGTIVDYENKFRNYGYKDYDLYKIRVIYLNTVDVSAEEITGDWNISNEQMTWLMNTALDLSSKEDQSEWGVIAFSHHHIGYGNNDLLTIINGFKGKESGTTIPKNPGDPTYDYAFSNVTAEFICHFHGHLHNFRAETLGTNKVLTITIPNACHGRNNEYGTDPDYSDEVHEKCGDPDADGNQRVFAKAETGTTETAFNVVSVDRKYRKIYCYNYGAGIDRIWDYANGFELTTYNIRTELTNCTASQSNATEIYSADSETLIFTANENCTLPEEITVVGAEYTWDSATGELILSKARRNVIITIVAEVNAGTPTTYSVTNTLTQITNNNSTNTVEEGSTYTATLVPDEGRELRNDIVVTMGGVDITEASYSNGVINIPSVTGNITITGSSKRQGYEVDVASIGYTDGKRWSTTTGDLSSATGYTAINLIEFERDEGEVALIHLYSTKGDAGNWLVDWKHGTNCTNVCYSADGQKVKAGYLSTEQTTDTAWGTQNYHNEDGTVTVRVFDPYGASVGTELRINGIKVAGYGLGENARIRIEYE